MNPYAVRRAWNDLKKHALHAGGELVPSMAQAAIEKWASVEAGARSGMPRAMREAFASSVAGAAMVDVAIEKLAEAGRYTEVEREFLLDLNAEAAVRDLQHLCKTSGFLTNALQSMQRNPEATGSVLGGAVGAGLGAWKDDENRLRGAVSYGVPGAVMGGLAGHAYRNHSQGVAQAQGAAQQLNQQAGQLPQDATRWHMNLKDAVNSMATDPELQDRYGQALPRLQAVLNDMSHDIIQHATMNPGKIHPHAIKGMDEGLVKKMLAHAQLLHDQGPYVPVGHVLPPEELATAAMNHVKSKAAGPKGKGP